MYINLKDYNNELMEDFYDIEKCSGCGYLTLKEIKYILNANSNEKRGLQSITYKTWELFKIISENKDMLNDKVEFRLYHEGMINKLNKINYTRSNFSSTKDCEDFYKFISGEYISMQSIINILINDFTNGEIIKILQEGLWLYREVIKNDDIE